MTQKESVNAWTHQLLQRRCVSNESFDLIIYCHLLLAIEPFELFLNWVKRLVRQFAQIDGLVVVLASLLIERSGHVKICIGETATGRPSFASRLPTRLEGRG